jgi:hypothetical protein
LIVYLKDKEKWIYEALVFFFINKRN